MPRYSNGQMVSYKPVGGISLPLLSGLTSLILSTSEGRDSNTSTSTGKIMSVLTEPGRQADRNVDASEQKPRYEVSVL
ncbi:hypothetical protein BJY04DRAFT_197194, partial [Aspergillus karnatakaensis]|uniref:DUF2945 domain-containing protein n=1 Tax=Aspergillus karnatakaensis TaxID=1810916 RepID=UPI003CCE4917